MTLTTTRPVFKVIGRIAWMTFDLGYTVDQSVIGTEFNSIEDLKEHLLYEERREGKLDEIILEESTVITHTFCKDEPQEDILPW